MNRFLIILFFIGSVDYTVEAQLIEDSDRKLKTEKIEKRRFSFFRSKKRLKSSNEIPFSRKGKSPRYSTASSPFKLSGSVSPRVSSAKESQRRYQIRPRYSVRRIANVKIQKSTRRYSGGNPFRGIDYRISPRYSPSSPFRGKDYRVNIHYSPGNLFRGVDYRISPRYSPSSPFRGKDYRVNIRYSPSSPFRRKDYRVNIRYSPSSPFRGKDYRVNIRYSPSSPFRGKDYRVNIRYSPSSPFRGKDYRVNIRYSPSSPFRGKDYRVNIRYSPSSPFRGKDYRVNIRYSPGNPFRGINYKIRPRYSDSKNRFAVDRKWKTTKYRYYNESSLWRGDLKIKHKKIGNQHPTNNFHLTVKFKSPKFRKMFKKWNIFWTRISGNKQSPDGVNKSEKKPKFDKKERVIWNN